MIPPSQHEVEERAILDRLRWLDPRFEPGLWKRANPPNPDFYRDCGSTITGLEITRFHKSGEVVKKKEAEEERILNAACECYASNHEIYLSVRVHWNASFFPDRSVRKLITDHLCKVVCANIPVPGQRISIDPCEVPPPDIPEGIDLLQVDRLLEYTLNFWTSSRAAFVPEITPLDIQGVINLKSQKRRKYSSTFDQLWLLIVGEGTAPSSHGNPSDEMVSHAYHGQFDKVFLASFMPPRIIELKLET
jgi:hypothetical protein